MVKKKYKYKKKSNIFINKLRNRKYLVIGFFLLLIVFLILIQKYQKDPVVIENRKNNLENEQVESINITKEDGQAILNRYSKMYKNAIPFFEESFKNAEQEKIWNFIKNNTLLNENTNNTEKSFVPLVILSDKSKYNINLIGFDVSTLEFQKEAERLSMVSKIQNFLIFLGYKKMELGSKTNLFKLVDTYENVKDFFVKGDQIVRIYYQNGDCYENMFGGCYIRLTYVNNIEKQIDTHTKILSKLVDNGGSVGLFFNSDLASSLVNGGYLIDGFELDKNYAYIRVGKYNSDYEGCLFKINSEGNYELALSEKGVYGKTPKPSDIDGYPKSVLCWLYLPSEMPDESRIYYQSVIEQINFCK